MIAGHLSYVLLRRFGFGGQTCDFVEPLHADGAAGGHHGIVENEFKIGARQRPPKWDYLLLNLWVAAVPERHDVTIGQFITFN